jgi:glycosyltransferase involved in cell wall biosynthesis
VFVKKKIPHTKKKILCFIKYYLPGYKYGGPVRSIANFVEKFGENYDIYIVCSSHDSSDNIPYKGITIEAWNQVGKAKVFYVSNKNIKFKKIYKLLRETNFDIIYLNSFFTFTFSIFPLLIQYLGLINLKSCVIAPRGEFAKNAIKIKKIKKKFYIFLVKIFGLYDNLCWQASSVLEKEDIRREFGDIATNIQIAPDLLIHNFSKQIETTNKKKDILRIVFLSRISPMKNLDFLLRALINVSYPVELTILGPKEDLKYWEDCKNLILKLPIYVKIKIGEEVLPEKIKETFSKYDLFVFPTRGENFGHVIPEALSAGTPILLSNKTPWKQDTSLGLQTLPLNENEWSYTIDQWSNLSNENLLKRKQAALNYAIKIDSENKQSFISNKILFDYKSSCLN